MKDYNHSSFVVDPNVVLASATALSDSAGKIAESSTKRLNEESKQNIALKKESQALNKRIKVECGSKFKTGKRKKSQYEECRNRVIKNFDSRILDDKQKVEFLRQEELKFKEKKIKEAQKSKKTQYIIIAGVILVAIAGFIYYKRRK
jgi:LPXTG-motif cell wall-anchored protein